MTFSALTGGAGEAALGDTLTGLEAGYRDTLFLVGRNRIDFMAGTSAADFQKHEVSPEAGALPNTVVAMDELFVYDDRGLRAVSASDKFGDFEVGTLTHRMSKLVRFWKDNGALPTAAVRLRSEAQYRMFLSNGEALCATYVERGRGVQVELTNLSFPAPVQHVWAAEEADGRERVFFTMRGRHHVYEMNVGDDFDGEPIPFHLRLPWNDFGTAGVVKHYRKFLLEGEADFPAELLVAVDFDDDQDRRSTDPDTVRVQAEVYDSPPFWDEAQWNRSSWGLLPQPAVDVRIGGRGRNFALRVTSPEEPVPVHTLGSVTAFYFNRKQRR